MARSPREDAFRMEAYQQYLLLANQQDSIRSRLSSQLPSVSSFSETTSDLSSYSTSPASSLQMSAFPQAILPSYSSPLDDPQSSDRQKLYEVNQQIKAIITDLLNVNAVRSDGKLRSYLQSRLMETEIEMRRQRKRRSSVDPEMVGIIAERFEHGSFRFSP